MRSLLLIVLSLIGIVVSYYIYYSKKHNKKLYCPIGHDCDAVVKGKYGKTFGIENTVPGIAFFGIILVYGMILIFDRNVFKGSMLYYFIVSASIASVLFSLYLTGVQAFILRKWCDYCIASTITSILILAVLVI